MVLAPSVKSIHLSLEALINKMSPTLVKATQTYVSVEHIIILVKIRLCYNIITADDISAKTELSI